MGLLIAVARRCIKQAVLARASRHRLGNQQFWMLVSLAEYPGQSQVEVGERLRADAPTVSRMVAGLSRRRLVRVALDARDRRRSRLTLTAEGERLALEFREVARELRACMVAGMTAPELEALRSGLRRVIRNMEQLPATSAAPPRALIAARRGDLRRS